MIFVVVVAMSAIAVAQPSPDLDPWGPPSGGSQGPGSSAPNTGSAGTPGTGSQGPGSAGTPGQTPPGTGSQTPPQGPGSGTPGTGSQNPGTGSQNPGTGSQNPGTGSQNPGTGSQGSGSANAGSGSGSASGPRIIQVPTDLAAPMVSAAASPTVVRLGNKFTVFITATFGAGVEVNLREPLDLGSAFEVTRRLSEDKPTGDGQTQREWQLEVIAWELGDLVMPGIAVTYTTMGKANQVATNQVKLRVEGVLGDVVDDPKAMRADSPPTDLLARDWFWLYVAIGSAAGLTILIGLIAYLRGRKRRVMLVGGAIAVPRRFDNASDRALHELLEIEESGILDRDEDRKKGYAEMVEVIREYLGSRYRVVTADLTTSELMKKLDRLAPREEYKLIESWLERCDIVKYGGLEATAAEAKQTLEDARALVVSTTQVPAKAPIVVVAPQPPPSESEAASSPQTSEPPVPYSPTAEPQAPYSPTPTPESQARSSALWNSSQTSDPHAPFAWKPTLEPQAPSSTLQLSNSPQTSEAFVPYAPRSTPAQARSPAPASSSAQASAPYSPTPTSEPKLQISSSSQPYLPKPPSEPSGLQVSSSSQPYSPKPTSEPTGLPVSSSYSPKPTSESQATSGLQVSSSSQPYSPKPTSESQASSSGLHVSSSSPTESFAPYSPPTSDSPYARPTSPLASEQAPYSRPAPASTSPAEPKSSASDHSDSPWAPPSRPSASEDDEATKPFNKEDLA